MSYQHQSYPSHRFHPSFDTETEYLQVEDEEQDETLLDSDPLWRDSPYSDAEREEWKAKNPKARKATMPKPGKPEGEEAAEQKKKRSPKPLRVSFKTKAEFQSALKAWNEEK